MTPEQTVLSMGKGGWVRWRTSGDRPDVFVRYSVGDADMLNPVELYVATDPGILTSDVLQSIPLRQITAMVNDTATNRSFRVLMGVPGPDLRTAAQFFAHTWGEAAFDKNGRGVHWVAEMWASQYPAEMRPVTDRKPFIGIASPDIPPSAGERVMPPEMPDCRIEIPTTKKYPPAFYKTVANLERDLRAAGETRPSQAIAEANGVAESSVRWWLAEARKKGMR